METAIAWCFENHIYEAMTPRPDNDELAKRRRIIFSHCWGGKPSIHWVAAGSLNAGWVVGISPE
jgi:hypothetical protein